MSAPPLQALSLRIRTGDEDLPEDRFNHHVNNARYFAFANRAFQQWYREMDIRGGVPDRQAVMAHLELDFLREVRPPAVVEVRLEVVRVGRTSLDHSIAIRDLGDPGDPGDDGRDGAPDPALAARGRATHVWTERAGGRPVPWPAQVLARCWAG